MAHNKPSIVTDHTSYMPSKWDMRIAFFMVTNSSATTIMITHYKFHSGSNDFRVLPSL